MRQPFAPSLLLFVLLLVFLHMKCYYAASDCQWTAVVNDYNNLGGDRNVFFNQSHVASVADVFKELVDSAIDSKDKNAHYLGFPYYLKIDLKCRTQNSVKAIRRAHYSGLTPSVTVSFQEPVHAVLQKQEELEIEMKAAPYRFGDCDSEEVCKMCWYVPMPLMNGSVVMDVLVRGNGLGLSVDSKRFAINVNGFGTVIQNKISFKIGSRMTNLKDFMSLGDGSRPLWHTYRRAPVLILGGIPDSKVILMSDTEFEDFFPIEVGIDSCWIGSLSCPQSVFSSSIVDSISTESTLFIRQNQLVYYFTGTYSTLYINSSGSELWTRILNNVCVKKLNPVHFAKNDTEYVIALGGGWQEGEFFLISCSDGVVKVSKSLRDGDQTVCNFLKTSKCSILWAVFSTQENKIILLVNDLETKTNHIVFYYRAEGYFQQIYQLPQFVPKDSDKGFVMLLGLEQYTNISLVPRGLALNPFSKMLYIWGNAILQSKDMVSYLYLSNFPRTSFIKYFVLSYSGEFVCVTDDEEIWVSIESGSDIIRVYPSKAWDMYSSLQVLEGSQDYGFKHSLVSLFYDKDGLKELVYIQQSDGTAKLIKRPFPLGEVLTYNQIIGIAYKMITYEGVDHIRFTHRCPFAVKRIVDLPLPQRFTRVEHYFAEPPEVMDKAGFHNQKSLAVFQGLTFQLLWLHSDYNRPYADPVHDPTWRWWKNKKQDSEYYYYVANNRNSSGGIFVDMNNYVKVYHLRPHNELPSTIFLDKNNVYTFSVYLSIRTTKQSIGESAEENSLDAVWLTIILAHPEYIHTQLRRQELISRGSVLYEVTIRDSGVYPLQDLSGKNLLKSSLIMKVARSGMNCYHYTAQGPELKGTNVVGVNIGCPPGKRLAFDITGTLHLVSRKNKRYFDCIKKDPEMPCFYFSDVFYPLFLIQDMVTGDSGPFEGSYILKIIGGGPYAEENIRYFSEKEILLYNTANKSDISSLIWIKAHSEDDATKNSMDPQGFHVFSRNQSGIVWVCQKNSPCYDIIPRGLSAPDYYFVIKVSNRGVDETTYCDYALEFTIHVHGLRLSPTRAVYLLKVSIGVTLGALTLYILVYILGPLVIDFGSRMFRRFEEAFAARVESSLTFSSSFTSQGSLQHFPSTSSETPSQMTTKVNPDVPLLNAPH